jgi:hypothetical protein
VSARTVAPLFARANAQAMAARHALADGRAVNLDDLVELVEAACRDLGELSGAEASALQPLLIALYDDLDRLAESLRREHDALKLALSDLSAQQRARSAYHKSSGAV